MSTIDTTTDDFFMDMAAISFAEWLTELNSEAVKAGFKDKPLVHLTTLLCWFSDYEAGLTPEEALLDAMTDGNKFGQDYRDI